jgi:hypothetical protein
VGDAGAEGRSAGRSSPVRSARTTRAMCRDCAARPGSILSTRLSDSCQSPTPHQGQPDVVLADAPWRSPASPSPCTGRRRRRPGTDRPRPGRLKSVDLARCPGQAVTLLHRRSPPLFPPRRHDERAERVSAVRWRRTATLCGPPLGRAGARGTRLWDLSEAEPREGCRCRRSRAPRPHPCDQRPQWTTSSNGRRFGRWIGVRGRSAG